MTTRFYSTKRNSNVNIPNAKVCGYKINNRYMRKGWISGLKAGRDNGIVNQKFSRFSTDTEASEKDCKVSGNVNWLNHKTGDDFQKVRQGTSNAIIRNGSRSGTESVNIPSVPQADMIDDINQRRGTGNRNIVRHNFIAPAIKARSADNFSQLQLATLGSFNKESLTKTLGQFLDIKIPDPTDVKWLQDKVRLTRMLIARGLSKNQITHELNVNKPLGRDQRTVSSKHNFAGNLTLQGEKLDNKLNIITSKINAGRTENLADRAQLGAQLGTVLSNINDVKVMSNAQLSTINRNLTKLNIPKDYRSVFSRRIMTSDDFKEDKGRITMFLMSNIPAELSPSQPIWSYHSGRQQYEGASLLQVFQMGGRLERYLDLKDRSIETEESLQIKGLTIPTVSAVIEEQKGLPSFNLFP